MPYLVTDPIDDYLADHFLVTIDGSPNQVDGEYDTQAGTVRLHHDITGVSMGSHSVTIAAVNMWGDGEVSDPFVFVKELPPKVSGIGLEL